MKSIGLLRVAPLALLGLAIPAQDCTAPAGAAGGDGYGSACVELVNSCIGMPWGPFLFDYAAPPRYGETLAASFVAVPPGGTNTQTDIATAIDNVTGQGVVQLTGGEFRQAVGLVRTHGIDSSHPFSLSLGYRSYAVDAWRVSGDLIATLDDPFGPGWRASWGDLLVAPSTTGAPVTRVDEFGASWIHTQVSTQTLPIGPTDQPTTWRIYDAQGGTRLVLEYHYVGGQVIPIWFREWPDRTRCEYGAIYGSGSAVVAKRIYRGAYSAPDWQTVYTYDSADGRLTKVADPRGIEHALTWTTFGGSRRVTKLTTNAPVSWAVAPIEIYFEYATASPYRLERVRKPSRSFLDDQNRDGSYNVATETFTHELVTVFQCASSSNRIERVYDESTGLARQVLEVAYDSSVTWRVAILKEGEISSLPGQGQRVHSFAYPQPNRTVWTDASTVVRQFDYDPNYGASPRQWRVSRVEHFSGAGDPRPASDQNRHTSRVWEYLWNCGCGQITQITMPSGLRHIISYDGEGRGLVTGTAVIPVGQATNQQVRSWTYRSWNEADYRLASRLLTYTDACGKSGSNTHTLDGTYGGYRTDGVFAGIVLFSMQEDSRERVLWAEQGAFQVDGATTSAARVGFVFGATSTPSSQMVTQFLAYAANGTTVYGTQSYTYTGLGWPNTITDALGRLATLSYSAVGQLTSVSLPTTVSGRGSASYGGTYTLEYDRLGQIARLSQAAHNDQGTAYPLATVRRTDVYDYFGRLWKQNADNADLAQPTPSALTTTNEYDLDGRLCRIQGSGGRETQLVYDHQGDLYQQKRRVDSSTWAVTQFGYHKDGVLARSIDPTGLVATLDTLDAWGRPERVHLPGDKHFYLTRDNEDRLNQIEFRTGTSFTLRQTSVRALDDLGRLLTQTVTAPGVTPSRVLTHAYNGAYRLAEVVDTEGRGLRYGYDFRGRLARREDTLQASFGNAEIYTRDAIGNVTRVDTVEQRQTAATAYTPVTYRVELAYDSWDRLIRTDFFGSATTVQFSRFQAHDSLGNLTWLKDGVGKETRRGFDAAGRPRDSWFHQRNVAATPAHIGFAYNDAPSDPLLSAIMTRTDAAGNISENRHDLLGRLVEHRGPGFVAGQTSYQHLYQYDLAGRLAEWRDGNGTRVQQLYDGQKRLAQRKVVQLPTNGTLLSIMATHETWSYDDFDRTTSAQTWWSQYPQFSGSQPPSLVEVVDMYDGLGRQTTEQFNFLDDASSGYAPVATKALTYGFLKPGGGQDASLRRSMTTSTSFDFGFGLDDVGRISSMSFSGPGYSSQVLSSWWREGSRPVRTMLQAGSTAASQLTTTHTYDTLRHLIQQVTADASSTLQDLVVTRDVEGNVTQHRYATPTGRAGDWFQLDGWDRLSDVKLGVTSFSGTFSSASVYDRMLAYALDAAHNRSQVSETASGVTTASSYSLRSGTNEYKDVTTPSGDQQYWLYDGNGNLLSDGYYFYVYDHLDRLSEVYLITYPGGATDEQNGVPTVQVYGVEPQSKRQGKETALSVAAWRSQVEAARQRMNAARSGVGLNSADARLPNGVNDGTTGSSAAAVDEPVPVLIVYYGYDPANRRIGKLFPNWTAAFYVWSGWEMTEAFDFNFAPTTVWFNGATLDEHLGYATYGGGTWARYSYTTNHTGGIERVMNSSGTTVERYSYDPYGQMTVYPSGGGTTKFPTVAGQVHGFAGRQIDAETGLLYYRNRYYQPAHGRFLTLDPHGNWADGWGLGNGYQYVGSVPHARVDPLGLYTTVVIVVAPGQDPNQNQTDYANGACAADPDGGQVIVVECTPDGVDEKGNPKTGGYKVKSKTDKPPKSGKIRRPTEKGVDHYLKVVLEHGLQNIAPYATDHPPASESYTLEYIIFYIMTNADPATEPPAGPPPPIPPGSSTFKQVLVSACNMGKPFPKPRKPKSREKEPETPDEIRATLEQRRASMGYRLADMLKTGVFGFDCIVYRGKGGHFKDKEGEEPAEEKPIPPYTGK